MPRPAAVLLLFGAASFASGGGDVDDGLGVLDQRGGHRADGVHRRHGDQLLRRGERTRAVGVQVDILKPEI